MKLVEQVLMKDKNIGGNILRVTWTNHKATQEWLAKQSIWNDKDMIGCGAFCFILGLIFGLVVSL